MALSVGSYDATLTIAEFKGLMQFDENESMNTDMRYAADGTNFDTRDGCLFPIAEAVDIDTFSTMTSIKDLVSGTVIHANRKVQIGQGGPWLDEDYIFGVADIHMQGDESNAYTIVFGDKTNGWFRYVTGYTFTSSLFSFVQYEYTPEGATDPVTVVLMSNNVDGMYMFRADNMSVTAVTTPHKFGVIAQYGDRIWGTGIVNHPELLCYSAPYDPTDWEANVSIPEDGAGDIRQLDFDGDVFTALVPYGNSMVAFKKKHIWRLTGLTPSEFYFQEQFGVGTPFPRTIVATPERLFFLTENGVYTYDGVSAAPFQPYALRTVWRDKLNTPSLTSRCRPTTAAVLWHDKYILSFADMQTGDALGYNRYNVIYDLRDGSWRYFDEVSWVGASNVTHTAALMSASQFFNLNGELYFLPAGAASTNPNVYYRYQKFTRCRWYGNMEEIPAYQTTQLPTICRGFDWVTPWTDMNCKNILKSHFQIRFWIQTHTDLLNTGANAGKLKLEVTVETERHSKTREMVFDEDVDTPVLMRFNAYGKRARFKFKCRDADGNVRMNCWCKIMGGVQINADVAAE